ncbi:MAG: polyprenyl synthetase family protein [Deltaproteobacteria bacterium]|nr:polyprenyl synthetase family protein [Deltaproteobacteria bacterium]
MNLATYLQERKTYVEAAMEAHLAQCTEMPTRLREAMQYSLTAGGKRLRPILVTAAAEAVGGDAAAVLSCACAFEMIHTYSLIHDDLPAMDNDDLRRGRPTSHKVYGEAMAILTGDALLTEAFAVLSEPSVAACVAPEVLVVVIHEVAMAAGGAGMVGGQALDMLAEHRQLTLPEVEQVHRCKTGALLQAAVVCGARLARAERPAVAALRRYGAAIGLAFQIADDLLAIEGTTEMLGKKVGNDLARDKATYPAMLGAEAARARMHALGAEAVDALTDFDERAAPLRALARYIIERKS